MWNWEGSAHLKVQLLNEAEKAYKVGVVHRFLNHELILDYLLGGVLKKKIKISVV